MYLRDSIHVVWLYRGRMLLVGADIFPTATAMLSSGCSLLAALIGNLVKS